MTTSRTALYVATDRGVDPLYAQCKYIFKLRSVMKNVYSALNNSFRCNEFSRSVFVTVISGSCLMIASQEA